MEKAEQSTISEMAEMAGVTPRTIRYYVSEGLLPPPSGQGLYKFYGHEHYVRLKLIKLLQDEDIPLRKIRQQLDALSLADMEKYLKLGKAIRDREAHSAPVEPREVLSALLSRKVSEVREDADADEPLMLRQCLPQAYRTRHAPLGRVWRRIEVCQGAEFSYLLTRNERWEQEMERLADELRMRLSHEGADY